MTQFSISVLNRAVSLGVLLLVSGAALAQDAADLRPPKPEGITAPAGVFSLIVLVVLAAMVIFAAAFPSKRGHQD